MVHNPPVPPLWRPKTLFSKKEKTVSYRPSQPAPDKQTSSVNSRSDPLKLLASDMWLVLTLLHLVPYIILPWRTANEFSELYPSWKNRFNLGLHIVLGLLGFIWLLVVIPVWLVAPGLVFALLMLLYCALTMLFCVPLDHGPRVVQSRIQHVSSRGVRDSEKWLFVNGVAAGNNWLQANVDMINEIFGRPVTGIHNRTYGSVFDLLECMIQRCFSYATRSTRDVYSELRGVLLDDDVEKVVVLAHSQGGIILSTALDNLLTDLPRDVFGKMEIYTFGCAANHFNNPAKSKTPSADPTERLITYMEHYCNEDDFVARFGVLHFSKDKLPNCFLGDVFEYKGQGGHLLNQHYLDPMFYGENPAFLEMVVNPKPDEAVQSTGQASDAEETKTPGRSTTVPAPGTGEVRKVKDYSRLSKYKNGGSPWG